MLTGCDSNPSPAPLPSESPSPSSSSPSPTAPPPTLPAAAKGTSEAAAKAFVRYWIDTLNYATATGETNALQNLGTADCESCKNFSDTIDEIYGAGGEVTSEGWDLRSATPVANQPRNMPILQLSMFLHPQTVRKTAGSAREQLDGGRQPMTMFLLRRDDEWVVNRLDLVT